MPGLYAIADIGVKLIQREIFRRGDLPAKKYRLLELMRAQPVIVSATFFWISAKLANKHGLQWTTAANGIALGVLNLVRGD